MDRSEMLGGLKSLKSKLMAAVSMLLVSTILLSNTTYAWFVLANAPEVAGVTTTTGSNGALEIALQSTVTEGGTSSRAPITNEVGQSSALANVSVAESNVFWGNIVDVTEGYGLEGITLYPARLNIDASNNNKVNPGSYLAVPQYGTDGRVFKLENTSKTHYVGDAFEDSNNYGVNVHGFKNEMGDTGVETIVSTFKRETVRREAVSNVATYRTDARADIIEVIGNNSAGMYNMIMKLTYNLPWTPAETETLQAIVDGLDLIAVDLEASLRWALLAYAIADTENYTPNDAEEEAALGEIYKNFQSLPLSADGENQSILRIAQNNKASSTQVAQQQKYQELIDAVQAVQVFQNRLIAANAYLEQGTSGVLAAGACLIDIGNTYMMQGTDTTNPVHKNTPVAANVGFDYDVRHGIVEDDMYMFNNSDPASGNLFSLAALVLGDYAADMVGYIGMQDMTIYPDPADDRTMLTIHLKATSTSIAEGTAVANAIGQFSEEDNVGTLQEVYDAAQDRATGDIPVKVERSDVTAYGYSIDLAFQSSQGGDLVLQQEATTRISGDRTTDDVQGGGSTMSFEIFGNMTADQVRRLLDSVYVVFMDTDTGSIYGVAKAGNTEVTTSEVTADLVMYSLDTEAMEDENDGTLRLGNKVDHNVILTLAADTPTYVTAIVYLNGDTVASADVSAEGQMSLIGAINMQFALDNVTLESMNYSNYYTPPAQG